MMGNIDPFPFLKFILQNSSTSMTTKYVLGFSTIAVFSKLYIDLEIASETLLLLLSKR
jgi:hypothetical protein